MKTTIDLPDELVREVKELARRDGVSMRELMVDGLRSEVRRRSQPLSRPDFVFPTDEGHSSWDGTGLAEAIEESYGDRE